jgi:hypothetical protein
MKKMSMAILTGLLAFAGAANATLLISDTFNTSSTYSGDASTVLNNEISGRQSGSLTGGGLTPVTWFYADNAFSSAGLNGSEASIAMSSASSSRSAKISLDHNFTDAAITAGGGFIINFRHNRGHATALSFGGTAEGNRKQAGDNSLPWKNLAEWDYVLILNPTTWDTTYNTGTGGGTGSLSTGYHDYQVKVTTTGFSSGTSFTAEFSMDGGAALNTFTGTWDGDGQNYIALSQMSTTTAYLDSFSVSAIPEPATFGIVLSALAALVIRRRRMG